MTVPKYIFLKEGSIESRKVTGNPFDWGLIGFQEIQLLETKGLGLTRGVYDNDYRLHRWSPKILRNRSTVRSHETIRGVGHCSLTVLPLWTCTSPELRCFLSFRPSIHVDQFLSLFVFCYNWNLYSTFGYTRPKVCLPLWVTWRWGKSWRKSTFTKTTYDCVFLLCLLHFSESLVNVRSSNVLLYQSSHTIEHL